MRLRAISGFGIKGPACFLLEANGRRLLLDCGRGPDHDRVPDLTGAGPIDAVLVSHAHVDHTGALDLLDQVGSPPIYATALTAEFARIDKAEVLPLRGIVDVLGLEVLTGPAGHAPGGIWMRIGGPQGLLYTGDFSAESVLFTADPFPFAQALAFDASYGAYDEPLAAGVARIDTLARSGPLLLPAPPGGRGLEMAVVLAEAGHAVSLCQTHAAIARRLLDEAEALTDGAVDRLRRLLAGSAELHPDSKPAGAMIAGPADANSGLAGLLATKWAERNDVAIAFSGHLGIGTLAQELVASGRASRVRLNVHPRLRDVATLFEACRPRAALPAFLALSELPALRTALSLQSLADTGEIGWES